MIDGAWAFLETLSSRYSLYIASNGDTYVQKRRIAESGIAHFFREIFISGELGAVKPKRAFFDACFEKIPNFDPLRAIILGDSLTSDVAGGKNAGITACWFNPQKKPLGDGTRPDFEVASYEEFYALLERL
jgi:2-haloacid dehalogenase